ncbi:MAG: hypothetical protein M3R38_02955 [Actinomycetota bacterium]|nr:hypothetical protein [Actinomycetota bacterium]
MAVPMPNREPEAEVFDFEKAELGNFEVWDRTVHAPAGQRKAVCYVTLRVGGVVGLNRAAREMLVGVEAVKVMFDPKRSRLGLIPTHPDDENSYTLDSRSAQLSCKKLFDYYGIEITESRRCHDPRLIDGILVVDL